MSQARLREALNAGGPGSSKDKSPPVADGVLSITPDTPEAEEWRNRRSAIDSAAACSSYLDEDDDGARACGVAAAAPASGGLHCGGAGLRGLQDGRQLWLADGLLRACCLPTPPFNARAGPQPSDLYGKFTWKIEKFSEISKRELRSTVFEVGSYKWCVCTHGAAGVARSMAPAHISRMAAHSSSTVAE